jgi:hypothetical protein
VRIFRFDTPQYSQQLACKRATLDGDTAKSSLGITLFRRVPNRDHCAQHPRMLTHDKVELLVLRGKTRDAIVDAVCLHNKLDAHLYQLGDRLPCPEQQRDPCRWRGCPWRESEEDLSIPVIEVGMRCNSHEPPIKLEIEGNSLNCYVIIERLFF